MSQRYKTYKTKLLTLETQTQDSNERAERYKKANASLTKSLTEAREKQKAYRKEVLLHNEYSTSPEIYEVYTFDEWREWIQKQDQDAEDDSPVNPTTTSTESTQHDEERDDCLSPSAFPVPPHGLVWILKGGARGAQT